MMTEIPPTNFKDIVKFGRDFAEAMGELYIMPVTYANYLKEAGKPVRAALVLTGAVVIPLVIGNIVRLIEGVSDAAPLMSFALSYGMSGIVCARPVEDILYPHRNRAVRNQP